MTQAAELHEKAKDLLRNAIRAREAKEFTHAKNLDLEASRIEAQAARASSREPAWSTLFRSAATLALEAGEPNTARKLIREALAGSPPWELQLDLLELRKRILETRPSLESEEQFDEAPALLLYGQGSWQDDAHIVGTRSGLAALRDALEKALGEGSTEAQFHSSDGEAYQLKITLHEEDSGAWSRRAVSYTG
jgi:hypothetical protein